MIDLTKSYTTRDLRPVRILCIDGPDEDTPVIGLIEGDITTTEWSLLGDWNPDDPEESHLDLIPLLPRIQHTIWINHYEHYTVCHDTLKAAIDEASQGLLARTSHTIDVPHGHGLTTGVDEND